MNIHVPVLLNECIAGLAPALGKSRSTLIDGTLGGAGHAKAFLENFPHLTVLGCDVDANAISAARRSLDFFLGQHRVAFFHGSFSDLATGRTAPIAPPWDAILLDLGYSSNQLEDSRYGMSFQAEGPLDMRLSRRDFSEGQAPLAATAWDLLRESTVKELADILDAYGEVIGSRRAAHKLKEAIESGEIRNSTTSLARFIEKISPKSQEKNIHPATLIFQALRIAVNDELRTLDVFLNHAMLNLKDGGRLAIIAFHSLEDRIVKRWGLREATAFPITKKPIVATASEIAGNPRARSAKLRIYEKYQGKLEERPADEPDRGGRKRS